VTEITQKRVLIVDDSKFVRTTFKSILSASFAVLEEADGEAGWKAIERDPSIVMIFTDLDMPKLDGFALLARIRGSKDARIRELPVVVISGVDEQSSKSRARLAGANDFIAKSADAPEVLSRIDNLLRLVRTSKELEASQEAVEHNATHDPLTATFTAHYLVTEGRKHHSHARRHGGQLSLMALRIDNYAEVAQQAGKDVADQLLARIAKLVMGTLRAEDSIARTAEATFVVVSAGTTPQQMVACAKRLNEQLGSAQVSYQGKALRIAPSFGVSSLSVDTAHSIEDLIALALQRLQKIARAEAALAGKPALPGEVDQALRVLESAHPERLGAFAKDIVSRLERIVSRFKSKAVH